MSDEEEYIHELLNRLAEEYEERRKPLINRLVQIHNVKLAPPLYMTEEEAKKRGFL